MFDGEKLLPPMLLVVAKLLPLLPILLVVAKLLPMLPLLDETKLLPLLDTKLLPAFETKLLLPVVYVETGAMALFVLNEDVPPLLLKPLDETILLLLLNAGAGTVLKLLILFPPPLL